MCVCESESESDGQLCPALCSLPGSSLSVEFSRLEDRSGYPFPSPLDLPDSGIKPGSPALQADSLLSEPPGKPTSVCVCVCVH